MVTVIAAQTETPFLPATVPRNEKIHADTVDGQWSFASLSCEMDHMMDCAWRVTLSHEKQESLRPSKVS